MNVSVTQAISISLLPSGKGLNIEGTNMGEGTVDQIDIAHDTP